MRLEHHLVGGYVRYISPHIILLYYYYMFEKVLLRFYIVTKPSFTVETADRACA